MLSFALVISDRVFGSLVPALVCLSSYLIAGELVGAKLAVGSEREGEGEGEGGRGRVGGREGEGGEGGREGGRESNRCVNAFLLECTVYHKTHTHTTWSPQLIILGFFCRFCA